MLVVLDTNILVSSLSRRSESNWVIQALLRGAFDLAVSNEILTEYEEILAQKYGQRAAADFLDALDILPNVTVRRSIFNGIYCEIQTTTNLQMRHLLPEPVIWFRKTEGSEL